MKNRIQAIESIAHAVTPRRMESLSLTEDQDDLLCPWESMQDAAELEEIRAARSPRRMRFHY